MILKNKSILLLFTLSILCSLCIGCVSATDNMNTSNLNVSNVCTDNSQVNVNLEPSNNLDDENTSIEQSNSPFEANTNENLKLNNNNSGVLTSPASTGVYYVDCTSGSDTNIGSETSPYKTIYKAVTTINTGSLNEYTVNISPGTYEVSVIRIEKNITFTKNPSLYGEVKITGDKTKSSIFPYLFQTPYDDNITYNISFIGLTLINEGSYGNILHIYNYGNVNCNRCIFKNNNITNGGAIYIKNGNAIISNTNFINNTANKFGGAIYIKNGSVINSNTNFINNTANESGGAIYIKNGNVTNTNTNFINNYAYIWGGALCIIDGNVINTNTNFTSNTAEYDGGAIYIKNGTATITNTNFIKSTSLWSGGTIYIHNGDATITNTNFIKSNANNGGGAVLIHNGTLNIANTIFTNNTSQYKGGAVFLEFGNATITNTNFTHNTAKDHGGAISIYNGTATITNTNFTYNTAKNSGGAIRIYNGTATIINTNFIANNAYYNGGAIFIENKGNMISKNTNFIYNTAYYNGGAIYIKNGNSTSEMTIFTNNTAKYGGGAILIQNGGININYSLFINNKANNQLSEAINVSEASNFDYCWWGENNPTTNYININGNYIKPSNTVYMSVIPTIINDKVNSEYTINVILNQYLDNTSNLHNLDKTLPSILVNLNVNGGYLSNTNGYLNENNEFSTKYICPSTNGTYSINVSIDNETLIIPVNITGSSSNPKIYGENLTMIYGTSQNYTGKIIGNDGKPIIGQHVAIKLSNSQGQSKTYYATTDNKGEYQLEINLYPGDYTAIASYDKYSCTNYIKVLKEDSNKTSTTLTANNFQKPYGTDANFTGKLTDNNGKALIGQHIALKLSNSQGQSKTYYATTDVKGEYQLAINLYPGQYIADCAYTGTSVYDSSIAAATIIVTS